MPTGRMTNRGTVARGSIHTRDFGFVQQLHRFVPASSQRPQKLYPPGGCWGSRGNSGHFRSKGPVQVSGGGSPDSVVTFLCGPRADGRHEATFTRGCCVLVGPDLRWCGQMPLGGGLFGFFGGDRVMRRACGRRASAPCRSVVREGLYPRPFTVMTNETDMSFICRASIRLRQLICGTL